MKEIMDRPKIIETLPSDLSKLTDEELRLRVERLQRREKKDMRQLLSDEAQGRPEYEGFIYILSHEAMPGLLKIGFTTGLVEKRAADIGSATGVPGPFKIEKKIPVYENPKKIEKKVHLALDGCRVKGNREFFRIAFDDAVLRIQAALDGHFDFLNPSG